MKARYSIAVGVVLGWRLGYLAGGRHAWSGLLACWTASWTTWSVCDEQPRALRRTTPRLVDEDRPKHALMIQLTNGEGADARWPGRQLRGTDPPRHGSPQKSTACHHCLL
jgi:hypothetical protein